MISVHNLCKVFDSQTVVNDLSFRFQPSDVVALLGPNGAGKTTTMRMLTGFLRPTSGTIDINGLSFDSSTQATEIKQQIGYLSEKMPAYDNMTVFQFLSFIAKVRAIGRKSRFDAIKKVAQDLQLIEVLNDKIENLSTGLKRRVGIAQAIIHDPQILILDEPTAGLDPNQKMQVRQLIQNLSKDKIIVISTHNLEEVTACCNRVIVIANGQKRFDDTPEAFKKISKLYNAVTLKLSYPTYVDGLLDLPGVLDMEQDDKSNIVTIYAKPGFDIFDSVTTYIHDKLIPVDLMYPEQVSLDDIFGQLTLVNAREAT